MTEYNASSHQWPLVRGLVAGCLLLAPLSASASESALSTIIDEHWQWVLEQYPERRLEYGDRSGNNQWTDMSPEAFQRRYDDEGQFVQRLEQLEPATLTSDEQINRAMLLRQLRDNRTEFEDGLHLIALNMRSGPQHRHSMIDYLPMDSEQDYQDWLARLSALPEQLGDYRALLQEGIARDRTQAQIVMSRVPAQIQNLITNDAAESPFYRAFAEMPESFDEETRETLSSSAAAIIAEEIHPALQELLSFLEQDYLPAARAPGIGSLPGGKQVYSRLAQHFTTTDLTPDEIHEIGLQEVARIRSEMLAVIEEVEFEGDIAAGR